MGVEIIGYAVGGAIVVYGVSKLLKKKKESKNIVYPHIPVVYETGSRRQRILKALKAEQKRSFDTVIKADETATMWAESRAIQMDIADKISHNGAGKIFIMGTEKGADGMGEIIGYAFSSGKNTVYGWMNSDGHRKAIMNIKYDYVGIACIQDEHGHWIDVVIFVNEKTVK